MKNNEVKVIELTDSKKLSVQDRDQLFDLARLLRPELLLEDFVQIVAKVIDFEGSHILIALGNGEKILGMLTLVSYPLLVGYQKTWIEDVVVSSEARGKGIGKLLMISALDLAKEHGIKVINLTSRPALEAANTMYKSLGFEIVETNYYRKVI
jgi:ribosomal protein S18 acetylase RimI-like enzyme